MDLPDRHMLIGMTLGSLCAMAVAAIGPGMVVETFADGIINPVTAPGFDTSRLVKFEGRQYQVEAEDWVSQDPISTQRIKKVEGGRVSYVTIATTSTGTYSSDVLYSSHAQYPGIAVEPVAWDGNRFSAWRDGKWFSFNSRSGNSFVQIRSGDTRVSVWGNTACVSGKGFEVC